MNLFLYQLRDGENEFSPFGEIAEHITINHSGSVVTKEPIDLGEYGSIIFDESNLPSFVGDEITIGQLLRDEFSMDISKRASRKPAVLSAAYTILII